MGLFGEISNPNISKEKKTLHKASEDLLKHYKASKRMREVIPEGLFRDIIGKYGSMAVGIIKELIDGTMGEFTKTEPAMGHSGLGQGIASEVLKKIRR